jgi:hypothetical protein
MNKFNQYNAFQDPDSVPRWRCPNCGNERKFDPLFGISTSYIPQPVLCNCSFSQGVVFHTGSARMMIPNEAAKRYADSIDAMFEQRRKSKERAEEALKDWPD